MNSVTDGTDTVIFPNVQVGEFCVFSRGNDWSIGKVLQFAKYQEKTVCAQQFKGYSADVSKSDLGVLCTWYVPISGSNNFQVSKE